MSYTLQLSILILCLICPCVFSIELANLPTWAKSFDARAYTRGAILHPDKYVLYWSANTKVGEIKFAAVVNTDAWVGLGLSANGGMKGADIAVLFRNETTGEFRLEDRWTTAYAMPSLDTSQNKVLIKEETKFVNGVTHFVFQRKIKSCDNVEDFDIEDRETYIIWSFGQSQTFAYHGVNRGTYRVNLLSDAPHPEIPQGVKTIDVTFPQYTITSERTQYMCMYTTLPHDKKYHAVVVEPIVKSPRVHHMIIYKCLQEGNRTDIFDCDNMMGSCVVFWTGWAVGGQTNYMPAEAGLPMGDGDGSAKYVMLQIHYDNPSGEIDVDPGSGFRLTYTDQLRPYDVGVLTLGSVEIVIPPNSKSYHIKNECPSECTSKFPGSGLTIVGNGFHMHQHGVRSWTQHIRDGVELPPIGKQPFYDFNHQNPEGALRGTVVMPGDRLIHHCEWVTEGVNSTVKFGESTTEEMCFNFIQYYPRTNYMLCMEHSMLGQFSVCAPEIDISNINQIDIPTLLQVLIPYVPNRSFIPLTPENRVCTDSSDIMYCGNLQHDEFEECDGVSETCRFCACAEGLVPTNPPSDSCREPVVEYPAVGSIMTRDELTIIVSYSVAGFMALILVVLIIIILVRRRK